MNVAVHVPPKGDPALNMQLSMDRAKAFAQWLVANGVERARIDAYGCGSNHPRAGLARHEQGQNERTEVHVVQPLPKQGMPSTLNCQTVELPK